MVDGNFELFDDLPAFDKAAGAASERRDDAGQAELRATISRLTADGLTRAEIARAVGIGESTLYANYFSEIGGCRNRPGRRAHAPTDDQRRIVSARVAEGRTVETIAAELCLSAPTVRKHYRNELQRAAGARLGGHNGSE